MNKELNALLKELIEWAENCGEDVWYIFDNKQEAIELFLKQRENEV